MLHLVVHDDLIDDEKSLNDLSPLADLRASFDIRTGARTTLERLLAFLTPTSWSVSIGRAQIEPAMAGAEPGIDALHISGRCVLPPTELRTLGPGEALVERISGRWVAFRGSVSTAASLVQARWPADVRPKEIEGRVLLTRPWHVRSLRDEAIARDLAEASAKIGVLTPTSGVVVVGEKGVYAGEAARVWPGAILDATAGAIVLGARSTVRPGAVVIGPASLGEGSSVLDRALVKGGTAVGPWCKMAGEIGGTIVQGFTNKAHDGHLGDSWVGEWVNLGAGTTNSNLLNTYGEVIARARPEGPNERTGETFLGAIIGDHVKTAIGTRLMTGCVAHTGAMVAMSAAVSGCVPPFAWWTDEGKRAYRAGKFEEVVRAVMSRRDRAPTPAYVARVRQLLGPG